MSVRTDGRLIGGESVKTDVVSGSSASEEPVKVIQDTAGESKAFYRVRQGGLMRCCLLTLAEYELSTQGNGRNGVVHCAYCKDGQMRYRDGVWEWDHSPAEVFEAGQGSNNEDENK